MNFLKQHPIIANLLLMAAVTVVLLFGAMWGLRLWTGHGQSRIVPDVSGMTLPDAMKALAQYDLKAEVVDSLHVDNAPRGSVVDQVPQAGDKVKPGRDIYLTINSFTPKKISVPDLTGSSLRQARATLASLGFTNITVTMVPSDYKDLVLAVKTLGVPLHSGTLLANDAPLEIEVGEGYGIPQETDSLAEFEETDGGYSDQPIQWPDND